MTTSIETNEAMEVPAGEQSAFNLTAHLAYLGGLAMAAAKGQQQIAQMEQALARQLHGNEMRAAEYQRALEVGFRQLGNPDNGLDDKERLQGLFTILNTGNHSAWLREFRDAQTYGARLRHGELILIKGRLHTMRSEAGQQAPAMRVDYNPPENRRQAASKAPFTLRYLVWTQRDDAEPVQQLVSHLENPVGRSDVKTALDAEYDSLHWTPHGCFDARKIERLQNLIESYQALSFTGQVAACQKLLDDMNTRRPHPLETH